MSRARAAVVLAPGESLQDLDHRGHPVEGVAERLRKFGVPLTLTNFNYYARGSANMHLHFSLRRYVGALPTKLGDFCAIVTEGPVENELDCVPAGHVTNPVANPDGRRDHVSVFVGVVQLVDDSKRVVGPVITSAVRLQLSDECSRIFRGSVDLGLETSPSFLALGHEAAVAQGFPRVPVADREGSIPPARDSYRKVVEDRPDIVGEVPCDESDTRLRLLGDPEAIEPDIRLLLWWGGPYRLVRVSVCVAEDLVCEVSEVLFRSFEFEPPRLAATVRFGHA